MTTTVSSPEEICNLALDAIGYPESIGDMYEGTKHARVALRAYAQTRDELLRSKDWPFARQAQVLTVLKTAPVGGYGYGTPWTSTYPPPPWIYEYAYPTNCLDVRSLRPTPALIPEYLPKPWVFSVASDTTVTPSKVILTNLGSATAVFTGQVTDMTQWEPLFVEALVASLARRFIAGLTENMDAEKLGITIEQADIAIADARRG